MDGLDHAIELLENQGLHSIMLERNNHKSFPRGLQDEETLERVEWCSAEATQNGISLLAVLF